MDEFEKWLEKRVEEFNSRQDGNMASLFMPGIGLVWAFIDEFKSSQPRGNTDAERIQPLIEALEWYEQLPMSENDQLWTQDLADQCINKARKALKDFRDE